MKKGKGYISYVDEAQAKFDTHLRRMLDRAAIELAADVKQSFGHSGVTGEKSGATQEQRAANRSKTGEAPHVDTGHLRRSVGWDRPVARAHTRRVGTSIGNKDSVGYAMYLEFGTKKMPGGRPFLRPAMARMRPRIRKLLSKPMV